MKNQFTTLKKISTLVVFIPTLIFFAGCANPNKAKELDTQIEKATQLTANEKVGVKDGNMIYQQKQILGEELRKLESNVAMYEDRVLGNRKYQSLGLWGELRDCKNNLAKKLGQSPDKMSLPERLSDKMEPLNMGIDKDQQKLASIKEELLHDRMKKYQDYLVELQKKEDQYEQELAVCKSQLK